jgi:hypothetical protein
MGGEIDDFVEIIRRKLLIVNGGGGLYNWGLFNRETQHRE